MDQKDLLLKALELAPMPIEDNLDAIHPEDSQKWADRYAMWYKDVRCEILNALSEDSKHNVYYQMDRLIQEARKIRAAIIVDAKAQPEEPSKKEPNPKEPAPTAKPETSVTIGNLKPGKKTK